MGEAAIEEHGEANLEIYFLEFTSLEASAAARKPHENYGLPKGHEPPPNALAKLVCLKNAKDGEETIIGFHFVGPNAGEVSQGFSLGVRMGATKQDFDNLVGIHPTDAEAFTTLAITRASGQDWVAKGGCGGGSC